MDTYSRYFRLMAIGFIAVAFIPMVCAYYRNR